MRVNMARCPEGRDINPECVHQCWPKQKRNNARGGLQLRIPSWSYRAFCDEKTFGKWQLYNNIHWLKMKEFFLALLCIQIASWKIQRLEAANRILRGTERRQTSGLQILIRLAIGISSILRTRVVLFPWGILDNMTWNEIMKYKLFI